MLDHQNEGTHFKQFVLEPFVAEIFTRPILNRHDQLFTTLKIAMSCAARFAETDVPLPVAPV